MLGNLNDMIALAGPPFVCELGGGVGGGRYSQEG